MAWHIGMKDVSSSGGCDVTGTAAPLVSIRAVLLRLPHLCVWAHAEHQIGIVCAGGVLGGQLGAGAVGQGALHRLCHSPPRRLHRLHVGDCKLAGAAHAHRGEHGGSRQGSLSGASRGNQEAECPCPGMLATAQHP